MSFNSISNSFSTGTVVARVEGSPLEQAQSESTRTMIEMWNQSEQKRDLIHGTVSYRIKGKVRTLRRIPTGFRLKGSQDQLTKLYERLAKYRSKDSLGRTEMIVRHEIQKRHDTFRFARAFPEGDLKIGEDEKRGTLRMNFKDFKNAGQRGRIPSVWLNPDELPPEVRALATTGEVQGKTFKEVGLEVKSVDIVMKRALPKFSRQDDDKPIDTRGLFEQAQQVPEDDEDYEDNGSIVINGRFPRTIQGSSSDSDNELSESEDFQCTQDDLDLMVESLEFHILQTDAEASASTRLSETHNVSDITQEPASDESKPLLKTAQKTHSFASGLFGFFSRITSAVINVARFFFAPLVKFVSFVR